MQKIDEISYKNFSGLERANLTISAFSRGDNEEVARLRRTCPLVEYKSLDLEYTRSLEDINTIIGLFNMLYMTHCNEFLLIRMGVDANIAAFNVEGKSVFDSKELEEQEKILREGMLFLKFVNDMNERMNIHLTYIKSAYAALEQFCIHVGINYQHIVRWFAIPSIDDLPLNGDRMLMALVDSDADCVSDIKNRFLSYWRMNI